NLDSLDELFVERLASTEIEDEVIVVGNFGFFELGEGRSESKNRLWPDLVDESSVGLVVATEPVRLVNDDDRSCFSQRLVGNASGTHDGLVVILCHRLLRQEHLVGH